MAGSDPGAEALALEYLRALGGDDADAVAALVDERFANVHLAELATDCTGRAAYRERLPTFLATFPERSYEVLDLVAAPRDDATEVVVRYRLHAVHHDASPADGDPLGDRRVDVPGIMWLTVAGGRILRRIDCWDSLTFLRQTGRDLDGSVRRWRGRAGGDGPGPAR